MDLSVINTELLSGFGELAAHWGPRLLAALAILLITHLIAKGVERAIGRFAAGQRAKSEGAAGEPLSSAWQQGGRLVYWLIWLFGLLLALRPLELGDVVTPLNSLLNEIAAFLPNLLGAAAIVVIGLALSRIARGVTESGLGLARLERFTKAADGDRPESARPPLAQGAGVLVQLLVLIPVVLAALDVLALEAVSKPLEQMLAAVLDAVPNIFAASIVLIATWYVSRWVAGVAQTFLESAGIDRIVIAEGVSPARFSIPKIAYNLIIVVMMLFAFVEAARLLEFTAVSQITDDLIRLAGHVGFGAAIIVGGVFLARLIGGLVEVATEKASLEARVSRVAIIGLSVAMGLGFMGIATEIVVLAFGLGLGAVSLAAAIAFGIGGRETAHQLLQQWWNVQRSTAATERGSE